MIFYCKECLLPSSKPYIKFDKYGVCTACLFHKKKNDNSTKGINWKKRGKEFLSLIKKVKKLNAPLFDVCVPVSGGKDSITQVSHLLNKGMRILCVNIDYGIKTEIGKQNLNCIPKMGASLITYRPNLKLHKKILKISFEDFGDPDLMSHCLLHAYPIRLAINLKIPMVLLGENAAYEYSGSRTINEKTMSQNWFKYYASNAGMTPKKFSKIYKIPYKFLKPYDLSHENDLKKTRAVFCSYFFKWSSERNLKIAKRFGFQSLKKPAEGTFRNYVGIDEKINRIHQFIKVLKFGYGRGTDHACEDIRNKLITRKKGKTLVLNYDRVGLSDYFVNDFIKFLGISKKYFEKILTKYTNKEIWDIKKKKLTCKIELK
tara:strand:+ start:453 stop:1571 length:1119 start_codon:yes stop_codon:yes gene_type:complete